MQFHHHGYVSGDPRVQPAAGVGIDRPTQLPDEVDVLIVGTGPAGMLAAAQLSQFPGITTRIVERRGGRLAIGQADGIQARSVETFQAFGFAERIIAEAYRITEMAFWKPDPADPSRIVRSARAVDDTTGISEFPHLIVNQARVLDYFAEFMANSPTRMAPDYGYEFRSLEVGEGEYPVTVTLLHTAGPDEGRERIVRAKYVVGADGARSKVRESIGCTLAGDQANHAWGVMDVLAVTDFPDIRTKCAIQSGTGGSILLIPARGRPPLPHVRRPRRGRRRTTTAPSAAPPSSRSSPRRTRSSTPTRSTCATSPGTACTRWATASPTGSTTSSRSSAAPARRVCSSPATPATRTAPRPARA